MWGLSAHWHQIWVWCNEKKRKLSITPTKLCSHFHTLLESKKWMKRKTWSYSMHVSHHKYRIQVTSLLHQVSKYCVVHILVNTFKLFQHVDEVIRLSTIQMGGKEKSRGLYKVQRYKQLSLSHTDFGLYSIMPTERNYAKSWGFVTGSWERCEPSQTLWVSIEHIR